MKTNQGLTQSLMAITAIVGGLITASMTVAPARAATEIIPVDENAYGNTYGEWGGSRYERHQGIPHQDI